jgi:hypothetical protein
MKQRLPLILSSTALVVAVLGTTPLGHAAGDAIAKVVPYASTAGFAKNAGKLQGHVSSTRPRPGQIPVVGPSGKLPAYIGAVGGSGAPGSPGAKGATGPAGPAGPPGASGYEQVVRDNVQVNAGDKNVSADVSCPTGKSVISGGYSISPQLAQGGGDLFVKDATPVSNQVWRFRAYHLTGQTGSIDLRVICATVGS